MIPYPISTIDKDRGTRYRSKIEIMQLSFTKAIMQLSLAKRKGKEK